MKAMLGISLYSCPYLNYQKCFLSYYAYACSSRKLEIGAELVLHGRRGLGGRRWGWGPAGRNDPNNVHM
jgi:hypothetical protein